MPPGDPALFPPDDQNPYAPPRSDLSPELSPLELSQVPFSLGDVLTRSWEIYRDRMGLSIGVAAVWLAIWVGLYVASLVSISIAQKAQNVAVVIGGVVGYLTSVFFIVWISLGLLRVMLDIARGREATIAGLFSGARFLWRVILAGVLPLLAAGVTVVLGAFLGALLSALVTSAVHAHVALQVFVIALGVLPGYVIGFILWLRLSQFFFVIVDRDLGALDSLRVSFRITRGHAGLLFVVALLTNLITLGGLMACGIGVFFTTPYVVLLNVVAYLALAGQASADPYAKGEPLADLEPL